MLILVKFKYFLFINQFGYLIIVLYVLYNSSNMTKYKKTSYSSNLFYEDHSQLVVIYGLVCMASTKYTIYMMHQLILYAL